MAENASVYDRRRWLDEERIWASKSYQYNQKVQKATRSKQRLEARAPVIGSALVAARAKAKARAAAKAKA